MKVCVATVGKCGLHPFTALSINLPQPGRDDVPFASDEPQPVKAASGLFQVRRGPPHRFVDTTF